jgi:hypothetical protein
LNGLTPAEDGLTAACLLRTRGSDEKAAVLSHETALSYFGLGDFNPSKFTLPHQRDLAVTMRLGFEAKSRRRPWRRRGAAFMPLQLESPFGVRWRQDI